jgi:parallel beta-helix repeat protein
MLLVASLGAGLATPSSSAASTVVVPDQASTVQAGVDAGADTVLVRSGSYPEILRISRDLTLLGVGGEPPILDGLSTSNEHVSIDHRVLEFARIRVRGHVTHETVAKIPRNLKLSFTECVLDSGFRQTRLADPDDVRELRFDRCRLGGYSYATVGNSITMTRDTVFGAVSWKTEGLVTIDECRFEGGPGAAIELSGEPNGAISRTSVRGYETGLYLWDAFEFTVASNSVADAGTGIALYSSDHVVLRGNSVEDADVGLYVVSGDAIELVDNAVWRCSGPGVWATASTLLLQSNVVGHCGGSGFRLESLQESRVVGNTLFRNIGSGIEVFRGAYEPLVIEQNIAFENEDWGLKAAAEDPVTLRCNDWFGNVSGGVAGPAADSTDLSVDPRFCNPHGADVRLASDSPLLEVAGCGHIGAREVGCEPSAFPGPSYPNPFRTAVTIRFVMPDDGAVDLSILDAGGRRVRSLARGWRAGGGRAVVWDGRDDEGRRLKPGVYFCRIRSKFSTSTRRLVLVP